MGSTSSSTQFSKHYKSGARIGSGTFATVKKCKRRSDMSEFAVKIVYKNELSFSEVDKLKDEIAILQKIAHNHPNIINIEDVFENNTKVKMVMELCKKEHLLDMIMETPNRRLTEEKTAEIIADIARSLKYLHSNNVVHRDLKPENILFTRDGTLKLADFGSAYLYKSDTDSEGSDGQGTNVLKNQMKTNIGTPLYVAPEILTGHLYSHMCDLWSLGVIAYICLCGFHPFSARKSLKKMYKNIINGTYQFSTTLWDNIDSDAIDLVKQLLTVDVKQRITCDQILKHKFITKYTT